MKQQNQLDTNRHNSAHNNEIESGKKLLQIATPLSLVFCTIFLICLIVLALIPFIAIEIGSVRLRNHFFAVTLVVPAIVGYAVPGFWRCVDIGKVQTKLEQKQHSYSHIDSAPKRHFLLRVFNPKGSDWKQNPYVTLGLVRARIILGMIIALFFLPQVLIVYLASAFSNLFVIFVVVNIAVALLNPGFILTLVAYKKLYGNEVKRRKLAASTQGK